MIIVNSNVTAQHYTDDILVPTVLSFRQRVAVVCILERDVAPW